MAADHTLLDTISRITVTAESVAYLKGAGIDPALVEPNCGFVAVALVNVFDGPAGAVFRLSPDGKPAVIIGARTADKEEPQDLIAWPLYGSCRDSWASLHGDVDILGIPAALRNHRSGLPLNLHRTPEDWLLSGFEGCCVVNKRWGGTHLSRLPGPFVCEDIGHGREVAAMLKPFGKEGLVHVPAPRMREAA